MIKRIMSLFIALIMVFSLQSISFAEELTASSDSAVHLKNLGILPADFYEDAFMTRGAFAQAIYKICTMQSRIDTNVSFSDVPTEHINKDAISFCAKMGYMTGFEGKFRPDDVICGNEAIAVAIRLLSYGEYAAVLGGYPVGNFVAADNLKLLKGTAITDGTKPVSGKSGAKLLINILLTPQNKISGAGDSYIEYAQSGEISAKTFLGFSYLEGEFTSNGYADTNGEGKGGNTVTIGGVDLSFGINLPDKMRFMIGKRVSAFYDENDILVSVAQTDKNQSLLIHVSDFDKYTSSSIDYYDGEKIKSIRLAKDVMFMLNGTAVLDFESIKFGSTDYEDLYLIDNNCDNQYDYAFVRRYDTFPVYAIGEDGIATAYTGGKAYDFSDEKVSAIFTPDGDRMDLSEVKNGSVLSVMKGENFTYAVAYNGRVNGEITEIESDAVSVNSLRVKSRNNVSEFLEDFKPGDAVDIYFDFADRIAFVQSGSSSETKEDYGYLIDGAVKEGIDKKIQLKIFTNRSKMTVFDLADRFTVDGVDYKSSEFSRLPDCFVSEGEVVNEVILYDLNEKGEIYSIDFPCTSLGENEDGFIKTQSKKRASMSTAGIVAISSSNYSDYVSYNTRIFVVPEDKTDESAYSVTYYSNFASSGSYILDVFHFSKYNAYADVCVLYGNTAPIHTSNPMCVVMDVKKGIDDDGEEVYSLKYFDRTKEYTAYAKSEKTKNVIKSLTPGDTVRLFTYKDGTIGNAVKVYDYETDKITEEANTTITTSSLISPSSYNDTNDSMFCLKGFVTFANGNIMRVTETNKSINSSEIFFVPSFALSTAKVMIVNVTPSGATASAGVALDIKPGDKVVLMSRTTRAYHVAIYR